MTQKPTVDLDAGSTLEFDVPLVALDALVSSVAVIDHQGLVRLANRSWREHLRGGLFGDEGLPVGSDFLAFCRTAAETSGTDLEAIADGVRDALAGSSVDHVVDLSDYSPTRDRWFTVRVSGGIIGGERCAVLTADDVSARRHAERARRLAARDELEVQVDARTRDLRTANQRLRQAEATLSASELRFRAAASATADIITEALLDDDRMEWYGDIDALMGHEPGGFARTVSAFRSLIHPDDIDRVTSEVMDAYAKGAVFRTEFRLRCKDGSYRDWDSRGKATESINGRPRRVVAAYRDITLRKRMEHDLRESEARFRAAAASTADVIVEANFTDAWVRWYGDVDAILGYDRGEFSRTTPDFQKYIHPDDVAALSRTWRDCTKIGDRFSANYRVRAKSGAYHDWEAYGQVTAMHDGAVSGFVGAIRDVTERKQLERAQAAAEAGLQASQRELRALADRLFSAQEDERRRLARELHDSFNQQMAAISIQLGSLRQQIAADDANARQELARVQDQVVELSNDLRRVSHELHPAALEQLGLVAALEAYCKRMSAVDQMTVAFEAEQVDANLDQEVALCVFRVAQEALRNAARHARATSVRVSVHQADNVLELKVVDDGRGFDVERPRKRGSLGLVSMRERVRPLDGRFRITSEKGHGTVIVAEIPLRGRDDAG